MVVTAYTTDYSGHFGDLIQYVDTNGTLQVITGGSSDFGCSHNTGIGLEAADAAPFASICAEDQGDIWLNTETQYMSGVKIANENTTNGVSGEPMYYPSSCSLHREMRAEDPRNVFEAMAACLLLRHGLELSAPLKFMKELC